MAGSTWMDAERARCRRPITSDEVVGLQALGDEIRRLRWNVARVHRPRLAIRAEVSVRQLEQIEQAIRRTRRSTLARIAGALVGLRADIGSAEELVERLAALAGPSLAPESEYRERVEKRRRARWRHRGRPIVARPVGRRLISRGRRERVEEDADGVTISIPWRCFRAPPQNVG
jgi:hypothetical protein